MAEIEVVYVTASRDATRETGPRRRSVRVPHGVPLPRVGESVIIDFDEGLPTRWAVRDVVHVLEGGDHVVVVTLEAPS